MGRRAQVLLRRSDTGGFIEVATIVNRGKGREMTIRLPDGSERPHIRQANELAVDQGSVVHMLRVDPASVETDLRERPATVFRQLLAEYDRGAKASVLKDKLHSVDRGLVDKAWEIARREFDQSDDVHKSRDRVPTYRLVTPARGAPIGADTPANTSRGSTLAPPAGPADHAASDEKSDSSERQTHDHGSDPVAGSAQGDPLLAHLSQIGLALESDELDSLASRPLSLGLELGRVKTADLKDLLRGLEPHHRSLLALVLGPGKERLLQEDAQRLSTDQHEAALLAGLEELSRAGKDGKRLYPQLTDMLARAVEARAVSPELLVELARTFAAAHKAGTHGLDLSLFALAKTLRDSSVHDLASWDLSQLARSARRAEFRRTGGRSALLAAMYEVAPEETTLTRWWEGADFEQLSVAGHGALAAALEDEVISDEVVRPIVERSVSETSTRAGVGRLWTAPPPLARWVTGEGLKAAMLRVGREDSTVSRWVQYLTDAGRVRELEDGMAAAQRDAHKSRAAERALRAQVTELEARLLRSAEQLAAARGSHMDLREAHERQLKLDLVKTLARLAAQVGQSPAVGNDQALLRSLTHATSREGLSPIGEPGETVMFDPAAHDPMGQAISTDSPVVVVRQGYTWADGGQVVVLLKAQVVSDGETR